jgi:hypothetical protein
MQWSLGQGGLFFDRAVILLVTVRFPGLGTKLRPQPHLGGAVGAPLASRFFESALVWLLAYPLKSRSGQPQKSER